MMSQGFKSFLELDPPLREALNNFYGSRYSKCLKMLDRMKETLMCDMYLASHVSALFKMIRSKAMVQYFR
jgi:COP9 signalosome complex subunit 1